MTSRAQHLLREALALPITERADVAAELLASLDSVEGENLVEDEAESEYREAGRWYEGHRRGLGLEFFDAVDAAISRIVDLPGVGTPVPRLPADLAVRRHAVTRFKLHCARG